MVHYPIEIQGHLHMRVKRLALDQGITLKELINRALTEYDLKHNIKPGESK